MNKKTSFEVPLLKNTFIQKNHRVIFYSCWLLLGLIQSRYTELLDDEAYYWVYSKFLSWGYFDHPPMIAVLIKAGYAIFPNELGVRFFLLLLNLLSLLIIEKLVDKKNVMLFYGIVLSLAVLQLSGFAAVPDTPLIFFTALFFLCYKKFLHQASWLNTFFIGLIAAALLYSKYHAVLIIFFVLLSNPKLFTRYQTYVAGIIALLFFAPHLWWQYQHNWISFRYHLFESNVNAYKISYTLDYIGGQILLAGPLAGIILLPAAFLCRTKNLFEKGLKFALIGIYVFFLLSSFRGKVEGNWTSPAIVPLIILSHSFLSQENNWRKWLFRLLPVTMILVLFARIIMIADILPVKEIRKRYHGWHEWPAAMKKKTLGLPVIFENSYQRASKYWFYSGQMTYSLNLYKERRNNYNFWPIEDSLLGKPVFILDIYNLDSFQNKIKTGIDTVGYKYDSAWASFAKVKFVPGQKNIHSKQGAPLTIIIVSELSQFYYNYIADHPGLDAGTRVGVFNKNGWVKDLPVPFTLYELIQQKKEIQLDPQLPDGKYYLLFSIFSTGTLTPTHNSDKVALTIE